jgi:hypothetical protein
MRLADVRFERSGPYGAQSGLEIDPKRHRRLMDTPARRLNVVHLATHPLTYQDRRLLRHDFWFVLRKFCDRRFIHIEVLRD